MVMCVRDCLLTSWAIKVDKNGKEAEAAKMGIFSGFLPKTYNSNASREGAAEHSAAYTTPDLFGDASSIYQFRGVEKKLAKSGQMV